MFYFYTLENYLKIDTVHNHKKVITSYILFPCEHFGTFDISHHLFVSVAIATDCRPRSSLNKLHV